MALCARGILVLLVMTGKQSNMATVVRECADVPCRLLKSVEANEDPS